MEKFILDTNIFFNMEAGTGLGKSTAEIVKNIKKVKSKEGDNLLLLAPPSIIQEIRTFFQNQEDGVLLDLLGLITAQSPATHKLDISAKVFEELVDDYRQRSFRGMKIAEEEIAETANSFMGHEVLDRKSFQISIGKIISGLRDRYRNATRVGTLDSTADFELIALTIEQEGFLVTADEGVLNWSRKIGLREMPPAVFGKRILEHL